MILSVGSIWKCIAMKSIYLFLRIDAVVDLMNCNYMYSTVKRLLIMGIGMYTNNYFSKWGRRRTCVHGRHKGSREVNQRNRDSFIQKIKKKNFRFFSENHKNQHNADINSTSQSISGRFALNSLQSQAIRPEHDQQIYKSKQIFFNRTSRSIARELIHLIFDSIHSISQKF